MHPDTAPLWGHVADALQNTDTDTGDEVVDHIVVGLTAALLAVSDTAHTHTMAEQFVESFEAVLTAVAGRDVRLPDDTACQINTVIQVGIDEAFDAP